MNGKWTYVGAATLGAEVAYAVARPKWSLYAGGRKPRGEWQTEVLLLRRDTRGAFVDWLSRAAGDVRTALGEGQNGTVMLDISEVGGGDLLLRGVRRATERTPTLKKLRCLALDVTPRDVERSPRVVARRDVLAPFLDAIERDSIQLPAGPLALELIDQYDALTRKPDATAGREDLVRAVALCAWAIDLEGQTAGTNEGLGVLNAY